MSFRQVTVSGYPALALRGAEIEVVVVPVVGMKLTNLRRPRGAPDRLDQAVEEWHAAQQLAAGEERSWSLEVVLLAD